MIYLVTGFSMHQLRSMVSVLSSKFLGNSAANALAAPGDTAAGQRPDHTVLV